MNANAGSSSLVYINEMYFCGSGHTSLGQCVNQHSGTWHTSAPVRRAKSITQGICQNDPCRGNLVELNLFHGPEGSLR